MRTYNEVEAEIAAARRFYNAAVTQLNNSVQIFPSSFIASIIGIEDMPFLKTDEKEKAPIDADKFLK
jgi:LemA protein